MTSREQIAKLIPGGVPDIKESVRLVSDLVTLASDNPEIDVDAATKTMEQAARAIFAQSILIAELENELAAAS